jgi:hypothetical protein
MTTKRKKQPTRGARKRSPSKAKAKAEKLTVEPLELRIELEGIQRNEKGDIVGKAIMAQGVVLPKDFPTLPKQLKDAIRIHEESAAEPEEPEPTG